MSITRILREAMLHVRKLGTDPENIAGFVYVDPEDDDTAPPVTFFFGNTATLARTMRAVVNTADAERPHDCPGCEAVRLSLIVARQAYQESMRQLTEAGHTHQHPEEKKPNGQ